MVSRVRPSLLLAASLCLLVVSGTRAQFQPELRFTHPFATDGLAAIDIDADGDLDVLRSAGERLLVHEQVALDTFRVSADLGEASASALQAGDVDNDLVPDLVVGDIAGDRIRWAKGLGGGAYLPLADLLATTGDAFDLDLVDVDLDGDLDLVHADVSSTTIVRWNENLGGGAFGPHQPITSWVGSFINPQLANHMAIGDVDQDGDADIAVCGPDAEWFANDGNGSFTSTPLPGGSALSDPLLTDLDGDGDLDLALVSSASGSTIVGFFNQGAGSFGPLLTLATVSPNTASLLVGLHDLDSDGDGDRDVVVAFRPDLMVTCIDLLLLNDGTGTLSATSPLLPFESDQERALCTGDMDLDGLDDLITLDNTAVQIQYASNGVRRAITSVNSPERVVVVDVENDGDADVLLLGRNEWSPLDNGSYPLHAALHRNPGNGLLSDAAEPLWVAASTLSEAAVADLDGDGDDDAVMRWTDPLSGTTHTLLTFLNDAGQLLPGVQLDGPFTGYAFVASPPDAGDLDGDGDIDVLNDGLLSMDLRTVLNQGNGSFDPGQSWATGQPEPPVASTLCDVDVDGDADILWWSPPPGLQLFRAENNGSAIFSGSMVQCPVPLLFPEIEVNSPVLHGIDLSNDGMEDLVVFSGDSLAVMLNTGGSLALGQKFPANANAYTVGDIDNSGTPDLVAIRSDREVVAWLNMGLGIFAPELLLADQSINTGTDHIALADMDNDGLTDVITCSTNGHSAAWMRNGGNIGTGLTPPTPERSTLTAFPVPMRDRLQVRSTSPITVAQRAQVLDLQGRIIRTLRGTGTSTIQLDRGDLAPGLYVVRVADHGAVRFVVE